MSFLYPQFLFGLLALGIPIIIHLFNFRRTKKIYFSNTLFLKNVKETTTSRLKVKHLLILLARLLFIFFLVITFAQPFLPSKEQGAAADADGQNQVYIYLDNSLSMSSELASNMRGIDQGVNYIEEIIALYPRNTSYRLLTNEFGSVSRATRSATELSELITGIELTGIGRSLEEVMERIRSDYQSGSGSSGETDIYLISDFQKSTAGSLQSIEADTSNQVYLVPVRSTYEANIFVDSVYLANPFMLAEETNELSVALRNEGEQAVEDLIVRLLINEQQVANASLNLQPFSTGTLNFSLNFPLEKNNRCQIIFEDYPVTFDNEFYFSLNLGDRIKIMEITSGTMASRSSAIAKVYANQQVFDFQSYSINNLDYSLIESVDLLVLNELGDANEANLAVVPYIQDFLGKGGHLVYIPPASANLVFLREVVENNNLTASRTGLPDTAVSRNALAGIDMANPFFSNMFDGETSNFEMPTALRYIEHNLRGEPLLRYKTGDPFLLSLSRSYIQTDATASSPVYVFSTPLRNEFTSLYRHAIFVPIMYRLASMSKSLNNKLYYYADESTLTLETAKFDSDQDRQDGMEDERQRYLYKLQRGAQEVIPSQRMAGGRLFMEIPQHIVEAGFYQLIPMEENAGSNAGDTSLLNLAFNVEKEESLIAQYSVEDLQNSFENTENVQIYEAEDIESFSKLLREQQASVSLWKYSLLLALLFLLTEILLIRFL